MIAVDRALHFAILVLLGIAVLPSPATRHSLRDTYYRILTDLQGGVAGGPVQSRATSASSTSSTGCSPSGPGRSATSRSGCSPMGVLEGIEAVGLWYRQALGRVPDLRRHDDPAAARDLRDAHRQSALKIIGFLINVAVVIYLLFAKRLFGLRGGGAADEAARIRDTSWEAIERATPDRAVPEPGVSAPPPARTRA